jgi:5,10-methylenetetrahydrofolate reductase
VVEQENFKGEIMTTDITIITLITVFLFSVIVHLAMFLAKRELCKEVKEDIDRLERRIHAGK